MRWLCKHSFTSLSASPRLYSTCYACILMAKSLCQFSYLYRKWLSPVVPACVATRRKVCKFDTKKSSSVAKWLTKCQSNTRQMRAGGGGAGRAPNAHQTCTKLAPNAGREEGPMPWLSNWLQMAFKCSPNVKSQPNALTQAQCLEQIWWAFGDLMRVWFLFG
jgi:hypothetical protein